MPLLLLLSLTLALAALFGAAPPFALDLGAARDARFSYGFYKAERSDGVVFRWSGPQARFVVHGSSSGAQLMSMRLSGERLAALGAPTIRLERNGAVFASFDVRPGWRRYALLLPPGATSDRLGVAQPLHLGTALDRPGDEGPEGADERRLGVPIDWVALRALDGIQSAAAARALAMGWLVGLLVGGLAWADWRLRPRARTTLWRHAALLIGAIGGGLALAAWRAPYDLAWALPPLWWALLSATALAAVMGAAGRPHPLSRSRLIHPFGAGALAAGATVMWVQGPLWVGAGLAWLGLLALLWGADGPGAAVWGGEGGGLSRRAALVGLALVLALALALRLYRIDELPFGLWRDEARHGLFALRIAEDQGYRPVYIASERVNMPALGLYPFAGALRAWGPHLWTMRLVTAVAGALTVLPLYGLAHALCGRRAVALGAAFLLAVSSWHLTISRFAFPTVFDPLLLLTGLWLAAQGLRRFSDDDRRPTTDDRPDERAETRPEAAPSGSHGAHVISVGRASLVGTDALGRHSHPFFLRALRALRGKTAAETGPRAARSGDALANRPMSGMAMGRALLLALAGVCLGLAVQTYHTGRMAPPIGLALAALMLCYRDGRVRWPGWRALLAALLPLGLGGLLVLWPLLGYAASQPAAFNDRLSAVFLLSEAAREGAAPLAVLDDALRRHLMMFHYAGDANGRHHAPLRPLLDLVSGVGMLAGLAALLRAWRDWRSLFVLAAMALALVPSALAVDAPHAMRAFGASSFAYLLAALGWAELLRLVQPVRRPTLAKLARSASDDRRPTTDAPLDRQSAVVGRPALDVAVGVLAALAFGLNVWTYFGLMPGDPRVFLGFYPVQSWMGVYVREQGGGVPVYVPREVREDPSFAFLAWGLPVEAFDEAGQVTLPPAPGAPFLLSGYFAEQEAAALAPFLSPGAEAESAGPQFPDGRGATFYVYRAR